jgi:Tfp pilus assembly protein PilV
MRRNEQGFSAIEVIVVIVMIILLGLAGWLIYNKQTDSSKQKSKTTVQTTPAKSSSVKIVKIAEAGVQFETPADYPTITYKSNGDGTYELFTSTIIDTTCSDKTTGQFGTLISNTKERLESLGTEPANYGALVNGRYWSIALGGPCDNNNPKNKINILIKYIESHLTEIK